MEIEEQQFGEGWHKRLRGESGRSDEHHCIGCPAIARDLLDAMLGESASSCGFDSVALEAREPMPASWGRKYAFALVRRGYLVRQRVDASGQPAAVDAVGPGCAFPLLGLEDSSPGYAVSRALVCLCTPATLEGALDQGGATAVDLMRLQAESLQRVERLSQARGRSSAASKVAALLCALSTTLRPGRPERDIPEAFLQRDLAALLSIRHESVCRALRSFVDDGLIAREGDGLVLLQPAGLERQ